MGPRSLLALVLVATLAGCGSAPPPAVTPTLPEETPDRARVETVNFTGELVATPASPVHVMHTFVVGMSVVEVRVGLNWSLAADDVTFELRGPDGKRVGTSVKDGATSRTLTTVEPPAPGTWTLVVSSERALKDTYKATVTLSDPIPGVRTLQEALALGAAGFAEINFVMEGNETVRYEWALRDPNGNAAFNVHSHENGKVIVHAEATGQKGAGNFTAPHREIYSLLWENKGVTPTAVELQMVGAFRMHSQTGLAS